MSDMLVEMKECVEKHDSVASDEESAAEVEPSNNLSIYTMRWRSPAKSYRWQSYTY